MESSTTTTSSPISTRRLACSITSSETCVWFSAGMSKVEATTLAPDGALHVRDLLGTLVDEQAEKRCTSGLLAAMDWQIFLRTVVLPALGGDTMSPR